MSDLNKHTPGPWHKKGKQSIRGPRGEYIANANWNNGIANATLISSAPDLLEALESLFEVYGDEPETDYAKGIHLLVRAAISKARGQS